MSSTVLLLKFVNRKSYNIVEYHRLITINYFRYPLGERTISDDFTITGQDVSIERENTGTLSYRISFDTDDVSIGDWNGFKVC